MAPRASGPLENGIERPRRSLPAEGSKDQGTVGCFLFPYLPWPQGPSPTGMRSRDGQPPLLARACALAASPQPQRQEFSRLDTAVDAFDRRPESTWILLSGASPWSNGPVLAGGNKLA